MSVVIARSGGAAAVGVGIRAPIEVVPGVVACRVRIAVAVVGLAQLLPVFANIVFKERIESRGREILCRTRHAVRGEILPLAFAFQSVPCRNEHAVVSYRCAVFVHHFLGIRCGVADKLHELPRIPISALLERLGTRAFVAEALDGNAFSRVERAGLLVVGQVGVGVGVAVVPNGENHVAATGVYLNAHIKVGLPDAHGVRAHIVVPRGYHHFLIEPVAVARRRGRTRVPNMRGGGGKACGEIGCRAIFLIELPVTHRTEAAARVGELEPVPAGCREVHAGECRGI